MERIIISHFGIQKDYRNAKSKKGAAACRPSVALAQLERTTNVSRYYLLYEACYSKEAKALVPDIEAALRNNRRDFRPSGEGALVRLVEVDYGAGGIWDLAATTTTINRELGDLADELRQSATDVRLFVNLVCGTAEQRTALALWAYRATRSPSTAQGPGTARASGVRPVIKCYFARKPEDTPSPGRKPDAPLELIDADDAKNPFGFLLCKLDTKSPLLHSRLSQLERLLKRVHVGLDDVILLTGPSGAGKTMIAKMCMKFLQCLHPRITDGNCVHINMSAVSETLFESELFGAAKGAYTDAKQDKPGLVEKANGGILFLDEIGELPLHLQAKMLTFLDTGNYRRVGETKERHSNFLLICGTNRDLESDIPKNRFRRDLYERISMWHFDVPGLHERPEDLEPAIRRELNLWNDAEKPGLHFAPEALKKLLERLKEIPLAGNYRELHAIMRRLMTLAQGSVISLDDVNREINPENAVGDHPAPEGNSPPSYDLADLAQLAAALEVCKTAKSGREAGEILFAATKAKSAAFNGATYFQRVFERFGLRVKFKNGKFDAIERR